MNGLGQAFCLVYNSLQSAIEEDWFEDGKINIVDKTTAPVLVKIANELLDNMGEETPEQFRGKRLLVYGSQLKILPVERIEGAQELAKSFGQ